MIKITPTLALVFACTSVYALQVIDGRVVLDARETALLQHCAAQGGCAILSRQEFEEYAQAMAAGAVADITRRAEDALQRMATRLEKSENTCRKII